ncbi:hypothetical protein [Mucilaginibacter xinganensis]|uniref:Uncharacterized protein n=1 Tax=Mucilaginibacter xinganensis TaxID=1234841 RepID=A0A223NWZ2_9SPHI|nr:hypothetical protein [Mucilaginibacter xinganensis]ASU34399.1 hypothetical protein MuYL_2512 [Mucilaginibacter xinganensis]
MNEYKVTIEGFAPEFLKADRMEYKDGFVLFYIGEELTTVVFAPISVVKKS